jgi:hypothetical protein
MRSLKKNVKTMGRVVVLSAAVAVILAGLGSFSTLMAASTTADATIRVITDISIAKDVGKDLLFPDAVRGQAAHTIAPADAESAQFTVSGAPNKAYTITLPADGVVVMQTGGGGANQDIAVNTFTSSPAAGANGLTNGAGTQALRVGATRGAIGAAQVIANDYTATFTVIVAY